VINVIRGFMGNVPRCPPIYSPFSILYFL